MLHADYAKDSPNLAGAVAMGAGVMIAAGIFAPTGQVAELAGPLVSARLSGRCHGQWLQRLHLHQAFQCQALIPVLAVGLIVAALLVNLAGNTIVDTNPKVTTIVLVGETLLFATATIWVSG